MSERVRALLLRLREYVGNRRRAPRYVVRLPVKVGVRGAPELVGAARVSTINGHTRDLSADGLAIILPAIRAGSIYLTQSGTILRLTLELPDGATLELDATPVRYHQLEADDAAGRSYVVGVRITGINEMERVRLDALLASLK